MLRVFHDLESLSRAAATHFIQIANESIAQRGRFLVALNGGGTPKRLFQLLAAAPDKMDWSRTHVFWGDERLVPPDDAESCYGLAKGLLLDFVPIPADHIHRVLTHLEPAEAASDYARTLQRFAPPPLAWPRFDLALLGMGDDGHTASFFPNSPTDVSEPVIPVVARYQDRPARRVTLTPPVFNSAREIMFLVAGASKAEALKRVLNGENPLQYPAARIQPTDGTILWLVDDAAAGKLD
jgi:6-phosphogluconolactonase